MINFPLLRLQSGHYQIEELDLKTALKLSVIPFGQNEYAISQFIDACVKTEQGDKVNPRALTVEDRMMLVAHYLASTSDTPDFAIGRANFSDYLVGEDAKGRVQEATVGEVAQDNWLVKPLTGEHSEAIERTMGAVEGINDKVHWLVGRMACQLHRDGETRDYDDIDTWLIERITVMTSFPESDFASLFFAFEETRKKLQHLFIIGNDGAGLVAKPREEDSAFSAARFPVDSCITGFVKSMA